MPPKLTPGYPNLRSPEGVKQMVPHMSAALRKQLQQRDRYGPRVQRHHKLVKNSQSERQDSEDDSEVADLEKNLYNLNKEDQKIDSLHEQ